MVHAEFKGVPFFRIEILVSVISRVQLVQIRRDEEFLVVEVEICLLILLETERKGWGTDGRRSWSGGHSGAPV